MYQPPNPMCSRDDVSSRGEHSSGGMRRKAAVAYLKTVQDTFEDNEEKYDKFLEVLRDFQSHRIGTIGVMAKLMELFKRHKDLILGFNTFLPDGYEIKVPSEDEQQRSSQKKESELNNFLNNPFPFGMKCSRDDVSSRGEHSRGGMRRKAAVAYLKTVQDTFEDNEEKYDKFLEVLRDFQSHRIGTIGVMAKLVELFKLHKDLILGFNTFLPDGYEIKVPSEDEQQRSSQKEESVDLEDAINFVEKVKTHFEDNDRAYKVFVEILRRYKRKQIKFITDVHWEVAALFKDRTDLFEEFTRFLPRHASATNALVSLSLS